MKNFQFLQNYFLQKKISSLCGGALIRYNFVLTTVVCIRDAVDIILRFGVVDRLEGPTSAIFRITSRDHIIIHENFTSSPVSNDVALLYLDGAETLTQDPYVDLIYLPTKDDAERDVIGMVGNATGFGLQNDDDPPLLSLELRYVALSIISSVNCSQIHGNSVNFTDKFCVDTSNGSTCVGDEGAPLVFEIDGKKVLGGIGSIPVSQCTRGIPAIFTNLLPHLSWIEDNVDEPPATSPSPPTTPSPPSPDRCNCVCRCYVCPCQDDPNATTAASENFKRRWIEQ